MASNTITTTRQITMPCAPAEARDRVRRAMTNRKGKVSEHDDALTAKFGSQLLMRLIGGWFVSASTLPVTAQATFSASDSGTLVSIHVGDAMGVGAKVGMNDKFTDAVNAVADTLAAA